MKICYISSSSIPSKTANSIHVMKMCQAFTNKNIKIELLCPAFKDIDKDIDEFSYYGIKTKFNIRRVLWPDFKGSGYLYGILASIYSVFLRAQLNYCRNLVGAFFSALFGKETVLEVHSPIKNSGRLIDFLFRGLIRLPRFKGLVVITKSLKDYYESNYPFLLGKIHVAPDGSDVCEIEKNICSESENKVNIGYVGSLHSGKGMEIIASLVPLIRDVNFHVVGGDESQVDFWSNKLNRYDNIIFHGFLNHAIVPQYISSFDIVLVPNQNQVLGAGKGTVDIGKWTSPLKIFEYMSCGKAIVASDLPVLREVLKNGYNSMLCSPVNISEWLKAIELLRQDNQLRSYIGENAKFDFLENYTWDIRAKKIIEKFL